KSPHKTSELRLAEIASEVDACDTRSGQQLSKTFFGSGSSKRYTIQQNLLPRGSQQQSCFAALVERGAQLFPGNLKLRTGANVAELVEPRVFQQNVQAADKLARSRSGIRAHRSSDFCKFANCRHL